MTEEETKETEEKEEEKKEPFSAEATAGKEKPEEKKEKEKPEEKKPEEPIEAAAEKKAVEAVEEKKEEKVKKEVKKEEKPKKEVKVPKKFKQLVKEIEDLKVSDLAELVKILEEKLGVSAVPQVVAAPAAAVAPEAKAPEKQIFTIELKTIGEKKIEVIKAVRDVAGKGLKEAKDLVDAVAKDPQILKENVKKEEAEEIKKKLEAAGATVELK